MKASVEDGGDGAGSRVPSRGRPRLTAATGALAVFFGVEAIAAGIYLYLGRRMWFFLDDWDFLVDRRATNVGDLFRSHNGHWVTLPILAYRALYTVFGLGSYLPYQVLVLAGHLVVAFLLRLIMRRAGVAPWTATVVAAAFALFGTGWDNILTAFQITMVGSIAFGLACVILVDHDGRVDRRDAFGLIAGLAALMCSGVGVPFVVAAGGTALLRRGWRVAALHTVPLGLIYLAWWLAIGNQDVKLSSDPSSGLSFIGNIVKSTFVRVAEIPGVGVVVAVVLVIGLVVAWRGRDGGATRSRLAAPTALLASAPVFLVLTAIGRALGTAPVQGRYDHVLAAMMFPALAVAIEALVRVRAYLLAPLLLLVVAGIPGNIGKVRAATNQPAIRVDLPLYKQMVLTLPYVPIASQVPSTVHPESISGFRMTVGWLRQAAASGRIPRPKSLKPEEVAVDNIRLSLDQHLGGRFPHDICRSVLPKRVITLAKGQIIEIVRGLDSTRLIPVRRTRGATYPMVLRSVFGTNIVAVHAVAFRLVAAPRARALICAQPAILDPGAAPAR